MTSRAGLKAAACVVLAGALAGGCRQEAPAKRYTLRGQILAVQPDQRTLMIKHDDIEGFMPAMTMSYPVSPAGLMDGRTPGELISGTLEVRDASGTLVAITHVGSAPLPETNEAAFAAGILGVGDQAPDAALIDQADKRRSFSEWKGTATLVTFIYTRCPLPNFCPLMDQNFATLQRALAKEDALRGKVKLVSVTFDPDYDTPAVLSAHAASLKADPAVWTFLTGDKPALDRFAAKFGVSLIREPDQAKTITHSLQTTLLDANQRVVKIYPGNDWTPGAVLGDLRSLLTK